MASRKDDKEESEKRSAAESGSNRFQQQQQEAVTRSIDETKQNIREAIEEARKEIPKYNQVVNDYQNQTIEATRDIAESYLDSQKQAINSMQSSWMQNMQQQSSWWGMPMSPLAMASLYTRVAGNLADATIASAKIANNMMFANIESARNTLNHARDNAKEMARIATGFSETFWQAPPSPRMRMEEDDRRRRGS